MTENDTFKNQKKLRKAKRHKILSAGFTLIEVAIVLLIGGLLITAAATMLIAYMQTSRLVTTQNRMQDIDNAIIQYLNVNGVLPCAASLTVQEISAQFGRQVSAVTLRIPASSRKF